VWNDAAMFEGNLRFGVRAMLISAALFTGCGDDAPPMGSDAGSCAADSDCDDGLYCNGSETCSMGACVIGVAPCEADRCIEAEARCTEGCAGSDMDADGVLSIACGGDDCDDSDPDRYPGNPEICDAEGHDEDCDPTTVGDVDVDGDGHISAECCNGDVCGDDCADRLADIFAGATETCDLRDQDCDGDVDEGVALTLQEDRDGDLYGDGTEVIACAGSARTSTSDIDCDNADPQRHGAQVEVCDGADNDCDGEVDENTVAFPWYPDADGDGFGDPREDATVSCAPPSGGTWSLLPLDCDDADGTLHPAADELCNARDDNCDGVAGYEITRGDTEDDDFDGYADATCGGDDCDDRDPFNHPNGVELCDGLDNDCDGTVDEDATDVDWYLDADHDGYGDPGDTVSSCERQPGRVLVGGDCADGNPLIHPGVIDRCNGFDDDCDGTMDEDQVGAVLGFRDMDGDGWGDTSMSTRACSGALPDGYVPVPGDCNDSVAEFNPGAADLCDGVDNDCDLVVDEEPDIDWYADGDGDGYGAGAVIATQCADLGGAASRAGDCNDGDDTIAPMAPEFCDAMDQDCDGNVDEALPTGTYYPDADGDGYAPMSAMGMAACGPIGGLVERTPETVDCDDTDDQVSPGATDVCDGLDNDCSGTVDDGLDNFCGGTGTTGVCAVGGAIGQCACDSPAIADCDTLQGNGCETTLATSNLHCGACGNACTANQFCNAGTCAAAPIEGLVMGSESSCAVRAGGRVQCWGKPQALRSGGDATSAVAAEVVDSLSGVVQFASGWDYNYWHHCAIVEDAAGDRDIYCWGKNHLGQLGIGTTNPATTTVTTPTRIVASVDDMIDDWEEIVLGSPWTLARRANGEIWGWGSNDRFQLGISPVGTEPTPVRITTIDDAIGLAAGFQASCALRMGGTVECWGGDTNGALGNGAGGNGPTPGPVVTASGTLTDVVEIDSAQNGTCARKSDGTVWCWGLPEPDGSATSSTPVFAVQALGIAGATDIGCGPFSCCAAAGGNAWCWGSEGEGQQGDGTTSTARDTSPDRVVLADGTTPLGGVIGVEGGRSTNCALLNTQQVVCWGHGDDGNLGRGTLSDAANAGAPDVVMGL